MPRPPPSLRSCRARGEITFVGLLMLVALLGGGYLAWTWVPVYLDNYDVKQVVRDYMHQAVRNPDDARLVSVMAEKLGMLGQLDTLDEQGQPARVPLVQVEPSAITWDRDAQAQTLRVVFDYARPVAYPLLHRFTATTMHVDLTQDISAPVWETR